MEIEINRPKCAGHAICTILAPDVFDLDDEGKAVVLPTAAQVPGAEIRDAADACPALAIKLTAGV
ncbi:ferredoxin [Nocardia speluncae]|uniref:Ferredoxin n=1 Tax=Nocardia speluncae TaxID=419477 RepID=A0A846X8Z4_9NOCA|nr:ferredoxin [Nocardia speluncae]NKY32458.1 ferredoxin [Nocardia speluncae]